MAESNTNVIAHIHAGPEMGKLGTSQQGDSTKSAPAEIKSIHVHTHDGRTKAVGVRIDLSGQGKRPTILHLRPKATMALVKGLLKSMSFIEIATDDDLIGIIKSAVADADDQATQVADAIRTRLNPTPNPVPAPVAEVNRADLGLDESTTKNCSAAELDQIDEGRMESPDPQLTVK